MAGKLIPAFVALSLFAKYLFVLSYKYDAEDNHRYP